LVLDSHGSHTTAEFDRYCAKNNIITLYMPLYSSYILQPLNVSCFAVLKKVYGQLVESYIRVGINYINKLNFLALYQQARVTILTQDNIKSSFIATRLVLFNPDRVLSELHILMRIPSPPP